MTDAVLYVAGGYYPAEHPHVMLLSGGDPVRLAGDSRLALSVVMRYRVAEHPGPRGPWEVSTVAYYYTLADSDGREVVAYHWHPEGQKIVTFPHLHLRAGARVGREDLAKAHIPTGHMGLEDVLRLGIRELGVKPRRRDWAEVLDR